MAHFGSSKIFLKHAFKLTCQFSPGQCHQIQMKKLEDYELTGLFYEGSKEEHEENAKK